MRQTKNWINSNSIEVFLHGLVMGTINKLPGISGGLYAIVIGFYSDLMLSIKKINKESLKDLLTFRLSIFSDKINGRFLLFLSIGMIVSYFTTSRLLDFMLYNYKLYVWSLFFGLILGSLYVIIKRTKNTNSLKIIIFLIGISFGLILSFSEPMIENRNLIFIFFCGFISICGITLPGLSGSFLLILLGNYELLLVDSVNNLYNFIISLISNESTVTIDYELINILLIFFL
jgi:putative membrane protein